MTNPGFIVDGQMERLIIEKICPNKCIRLLQLNGKKASYEAAGKRAASLIRLLNQRRCYPIIILFDREQRKDCADAVARLLYEAIKADKELPPIDIIIGVPDRMTENWMLADINAVKNHFQITAQIVQQNYEGTSGKSKLKQLVRPNKYAETQDGPEIFSLCSYEKLCTTSVSFKKFIDKLTNIGCEWLNSRRH